MIELLRHGIQAPGAARADVRACEEKLGVSLPPDYVSFLSESNGFNDEVGMGYLVLWGIEELAVADGYEVFEFRRDRFLIGSNGGPTAYGFIDGHYSSIPFVFAGPWEEEVRVLGKTFEEFVQAVAAGDGW
jgi:hypothetical protein